MLTRPTLELFDGHLAVRGLQFHAVVIGGSALALLGISVRPTRDCDILAPELPAAIIAAAREFAHEQRQLGFELGDDWLNNGPIQLGDVLPAGWQDRLQPAFNGRVLQLSTLGRTDLLKAKLFALCDRGTDLADCLALAPTPNELAEMLPWLSGQDANPDWPAHVADTIADLRRRIDGGV